jgi:hypothetical protein
LWRQGLDIVLYYLASFIKVTSLFELHLDLVEFMKGLLEAFLLRDSVASLESSSLALVNLSLSHLFKLPLNKVQCIFQPLLYARLPLIGSPLSASCLPVTPSLLGVLDADTDLYCILLSGFLIVILLAEWIPDWLGQQACIAGDVVRVLVRGCRRQVLLEHVRGRLDV